MSPPALKVMIVSANQRLQGVLPALLGRQDTLVHQHSVRTATEALTLTVGDAPDIVICDLPPANVHEVLTWRAIREHGPRIVMLTRYMQEDDDLRAVLAGAAGLILVPERRLLESVMRAARGDLLRSDELTGRLRAIVSGEAPSQLDGDERRVLGLIAEGHSDGEIAASLGVSPDDVCDQIVRITEKLG
jgi:DNA-binding NarL/FixJ family response regulator